MASNIKVEIDKETAFGVFAFLSRYAYRERLEICDETEKAALLDLCQLLDNELVETYRKDYLAFDELAKQE